jgi:hypothetical protein
MAAVLSGVDAVCSISDACACTASAIRLDRCCKPKRGRLVPPYLFTCAFLVPSVSIRPALLACGRALRYA